MPAIFLCLAQFSGIWRRGLRRQILPAVLPSTAARPDASIHQNSKEQTQKPRRQVSNNFNVSAILHLCETASKA
jgi:hypothetical protein